MPQAKFCGPSKTYPAHDAKHVGNAFARLSQFGHRLPTEVRKRIYKCLVSRAKRFGVEHNPKKYKWGKYVSETAHYDPEPKVDWFLEEIQK